MKLCFRQATQAFQAKQDFVSEKGSSASQAKPGKEQKKEIFYP